MEHADAWMGCAGDWLERDLRLLTEPDGFRSVLQRSDLSIVRQKMQDDPNDLFRWHLTGLEAPAEIVFEGFVHRLLDYHKHWTREFVDGRVLETLSSEVRVLYQRFNPGVPGIVQRDLCSVEVVRELGAGRLLASFRSIDRLPKAGDCERIDWWGAALCTPHEDGSHSDLTYLDRENQGGHFPAWLMNLAMPRYLVKQAESVRAFFRGGGPAELRTSARAAAGDPMTSTLAAQQSVSRTAYDCAAVRAAVFGWTQCAAFDYLAIDMLSSGSASARARLAGLLVRLGLHRVTRAIIARSSPGSDVLLFARTAVPDALCRQMLDEDAETQVVLLGAGLDTSALRIGAERRAHNAPEGLFFEVDLPPTQREKRELVRAAVARHPELSEAHVRYVPCEFGTDELSRALLAAGFSQTRRTLWIWSGVIHYLPEVAIKATLAELRRLSAPGSRVFFDFILREAYERPAEYGFELTKARFDRFGEVMSFGLSEDPNGVRAWLEAQGFSLVRVDTTQDMVATYERITGQKAPSSGCRWAHLCVAALA